MDVLTKKHRITPGVFVIISKDSKIHVKRT